MEGVSHSLFLFLFDCLCRVDGGNIHSPDRKTLIRKFEFMQQTLESLMNTMPQIGKVEWIGLRPAKRTPLQSVTKVQINEEEGLVGDHYQGQSGKRHVTLIMAEHLQTVAKILGKDQIDPGLTRRNIVVSGINLLALKDKQFQIGECILEMTGICHPCSRMEENLGPGGYNANRGHSGINARVIKGGQIALGDIIKLKV